MMYLTETHNWDAGVYLISPTDSIAGTVLGVDNQAAIAMADRTQYLLDVIGLVNPSGGA